MRNDHVAEPFRSIVNAASPSVPTKTCLNVDAALLRAASDFLKSGPALDQIMVGDRMMTRIDVAIALRLKVDPPPHGEYRDALDASDLREAD